VTERGQRPVDDGAREVARAAAAAFGGSASVRRYYNEDERLSVDVLEAAEAPAAGLTTFSTVTLHRAVNMLDGVAIPVEFAAVSDSSVRDCANVLSTMALTVISDGWLAAPGVVYPDAYGMYDDSTDFPHALLADPFPWPELSNWSGQRAAAHWLLAIPISDAEWEFLREQGESALTARLEAADTPYYSALRVPVA
jgi:hypothetical protein